MITATHCTKCNQPFDEDDYEEGEDHGEVCYMCEYYEADRFLKKTRSKLDDLAEEYGWLISFHVARGGSHYFTFEKEDHDDITVRFSDHDQVYSVTFSITDEEEAAEVLPELEVMLM